MTRQTRFAPRFGMVGVVAMPIGLIQKLNASVGVTRQVSIRPRATDLPLTPLLNKMVVTS